MPLRPLHDRLFVKRKEPELKTAGGIVIPDSAGEKPEHPSSTPNAVSG